MYAVNVLAWSPIVASQALRISQRLPSHQAEKQTEHAEDDSGDERNQAAEVSALASAWPRIVDLEG